VAHDWESPKKVCPPDKLQRTLAAINTFGFTYAGEGGEIDYGGRGGGHPGTGLRAPSMPLYNIPQSHRNCILRELRRLGYLTYRWEEDQDEPDQFDVTEAGKEALENVTCPTCATVLRYGMKKNGQRTGERSVITWTDFHYVCLNCKPAYEAVKIEVKA
jgi:hypothetical protein